MKQSLGTMARNVFMDGRDNSPALTKFMERAPVAVIRLLAAGVTPEPPGLPARNSMT
jgi:hypothetical protein